jgi:peptidylprolyl isomerase
MFIFRNFFVLKRSLAAGIGGLLLVLLAETARAAPGDAALGEGLFARISTAKGDIVVSLEYQKAPLTVCNFVALAEGRMNTAGGKPFFNGLTFHRVEPDFVIQGGDPLGNGRGGPGYQFPNEIDPTLKHDGPGIVSMANAGPDTNGSQFFITHRAASHLDGLHPVFGRVIEGQNVVNAIRQGDRIEKVTIIRNGPQASAFKADQAAFDALLQNANAVKRAKLAAQRDADMAEIEKKYPNAAITASGLRYIVEKNGSGANPAPGKTVSVKYKGMFLSGKVFDNSDFSGGSVDFTLGRLIPGMNEALLDMSPGEKRTVIIPPELAYGEQGAGNGAIPPNSFLVFDIELLKVK